MRTARIAAVLALLAVLAGCGSSASTSTPTPAPIPTATSTGTRPSSPAIVSITSPVDGSTVTGPMVHVAVTVQNATVVQATSSNISPDKGHVHVLIDGNVAYMAYTLSQDFPEKPGTYQIRAEFVASDHAPFNPRVYSKTIVFTVK